MASRPEEGEQLVAVGLWMSVHGAASLMIAKPEFPWPPVDVVIDHILATHAHGLARRG